MSIEIYKITRTAYVDEAKIYLIPETRVFADRAQALDYYYSQIENNLAVCLTGMCFEEIEQLLKQNYVSGKIKFAYHFNKERLHLNQPKCPHCLSNVEASAVDGYKYFCPDCEEDFLSFEVV